MLELKDPGLFRQQCFLNGEWVDARSGETITVRNPADGSVLGTVPKVSETAGPDRALLARQDKDRQATEAVRAIYSAMKINPACAQASAKPAFSDRNP
jgi:succinate-semialdehyde dehydrogenase/glutarate-semialdehyde dehydrogenase